MLDVTQLLTVGPNERLTDRSESPSGSQRAGRAPVASSLQEVETKWRKGCGRRSWRVATRPVPSSLAWALKEVRS